MGISAQIGARLRERRIELGWSARRVAEAIGVSHVQLTKFEKGVNRVSADQLSVLCRELGLSSDAVLGLQGAGKPPGPRQEGVDDEARRLMTIFRGAARRERREILRVARQIAADAPASASP